MPYFDTDFEAFFKELAANNNKEWFDTNRKRYEKTVKQPFDAFVQEMIDRMHAIDPSILIAPKDAKFRINRDIRFSKDKTPYKTMVSAIVSSGGRKDKTKPGMYFELGPEHVRYYSGVYMLDKDQTEAIRDAIAADLKGFKKLYSAAPFKKAFGEIRGEKMKRLPKHYAEAAEQEELIYNKNWYWFAEMSPSLITDDGLADVLMEKQKAAQSMSAFFSKALGY